MIVFVVVCCGSAVSPARHAIVSNGQVGISPCLPHPSHTTGRDSLESKVIFIQLSEWASSVECTGDKDFTALETAPRTARIHPKTIYT